MSFFIREGKSKQQNGSKRKFTDKKSPGKSKRAPAAKDEISSDSDDLELSDHEAENNEHSSDEDVRETAQEKRLKLAKIYLEEVTKKLAERDDQTEFNQSHISNRLKEDLLEQTGRLHRNIADTITGVDLNNIHTWRTKNNRDAVTCVVLSKDNDTLYSATKSGVINVYSISSKAKLKDLPFKKEKKSGSKTAILSLAISADNKFLAVAQDKFIIIRDGDTLEEKHVFKGHSNLVTGVVFRQDSHQLYSCSADRSVKSWSCDEMLYVETLFGHQSGITSIDALYRERAITAGGYDCSIRVWKIPEDSQLIYNGHVGSIDCVKLMNEDHFISGGNDGSLQVWGTTRKKALISHPMAHGIDSVNNQPNWVVAVTSLLNSDLIATGSSEGLIRLWKITNSYKKIEPVLEIPVNGFVNSLCFTQDGKNLIAAISREHRLGRWWNKTDAINSVVVFPLKKNK